MNRAKLSERDVGPDRHRVLCVVLSRLEARTVWICPAGSGQRRLDRLTGGSHHENIQSCDGNLIARPCYGMFGLGVELRICLLQKLVSGGGGLNIRAVVDEIPDRDTRREFG